MEEEEEGNTYGKSITSEGIPYASPVTNLRTIHVLGVLVDHPLCAHHADRGTNAIGHEHEQTLCAGTNGRVAFLVHEERTRDIEKVERYTIDDHGENEEDDLGEGGSANGK